MEWLGYECRAAKKGFKDTWQFMRGHIAMELVAPILAASISSAFSISYYPDEPGKAWVVFSIAVLSATGSWLVVIIGAFMVNLFLAPVRMEQQNDAAHVERIAELNMLAEVKDQQIEGLEFIIHDSEKRKKVRETLADYLEEGRQLVNLVYEDSSNRKQADLNKEEEEWATRVEGFLLDEVLLGNEYIARFRNYAGLPPRVTPLSPPHAQLESFLMTRMARIDEFIKELRQ